MLTIQGHSQEGQARQVETNSFEAAERATALIFFSRGSLRVSSQHYRAIFLILFFL